MSFDVDVESFFTDEPASQPLSTPDCLPSPAKVLQVYGYELDWNDVDRITISHVFGLTK